MGDSPVPIPNGHLCPDMRYAGGLQPDTLWLGFSGIEKSPSAPPGTPDPLNGIYELKWASCNVWGGYYEIWAVGVTVWETVRISAVSVAPAYGLFDQTGAVEEYCVFDNFPLDAGYYYGNGQASVLLGLSGTHLPASWSLAGLFGVPSTPPYFAEEFSMPADERMVRYACHRDKTNVILRTE